MPYLYNILAFADSAMIVVEGTLAEIFKREYNCSIITRVMQASWGKRDEVLQVLPVASIVSVTFSLDLCVVFINAILHVLFISFIAPACSLRSVLGLCWE